MENWAFYPHISTYQIIRQVPGSKETGQSGQSSQAGKAGQSSQAGQVGQGTDRADKAGQDLQVTMAGLADDNGRIGR